MNPNCEAWQREALNFRDRGLFEIAAGVVERARTAGCPWAQFGGLQSVAVDAPTWNWKAPPPLVVDEYPAWTSAWE